MLTPTGTVLVYRSNVATAALLSTKVACRGRKLVSNMLHRLSFTRTPRFGNEFSWSTNLGDSHTYYSGHS
ncbi:hypothetical protein LIA77_05587 [Sarocladium implicatum]|nr:hypothetical protein LIA77_05587 [Sarocladium implicatum]